MSDKTTHLNFIQGVITRMADNSFKVKSWTTGIISGLLALSTASEAEVQNTVIVIAFFPIIVFWMLDGYFLWQERLFRGLYDHVRKLEGENTDFSMNPSAFQGGSRTWIKSMFSQTLLVFYATLLLTVFAILLYFNFG